MQDKAGLGSAAPGQINALHIPSLAFYEDGCQVRRQGRQVQIPGTTKVQPQGLGRVLAAAGKTSNRAAVVSHSSVYACKLKQAAGQVFAWAAAKADGELVHLKHQQTGAEARNVCESLSAAQERFSFLECTFRYYTYRSSVGMMVQAGLQCFRGPSGATCPAYPRLSLRVSRASCTLSKSFSRSREAILVKLWGEHPDVLSQHRLELHPRSCVPQQGLQARWAGMSLSCSR